MKQASQMERIGVLGIQSQDSPDPLFGSCETPGLEMAHAGVIHRRCGFL
jgi:hypothetical protein